MIRRMVVGVVAVVVLAAGCSSDKASSSPPTTTPPTTEAATASLTPYIARGPYAAGQETLKLDDGRRVVVWYPADASKAKGTPTETFDIASLLRPELQAKIPADQRPPLAIDAHPGAVAATKGGPFPIVLFSHGYGGFPEQSATLTTHLASWGYVVAAPDHVERSLSGLLGTGLDGVTKRTDTDVLQATLALVRADADRSGSPLAGILDPTRVAVAGHSAGAGAAYDLAATDPAIQAFIAYAIGEPKTAPVPKVPGLVMLGTTDGIIPASASRAVFAGMRTPKYLVEYPKAGHLVFSDICLIGRSGGGIVAIGKQLGLPVEMFEKLGTDGCKAGDLPPERAFPAIDDLSVAFLRSVFGTDRAPVGLDDPAIGTRFPKLALKVVADP